MKSQNQTKAMLMALLVIALAPIVVADSYQLWCVPDGETVNLAELCNPSMLPRTGPINLCMHLLDNGHICPASPNVCNNLGLSCSGNTETELDETPPNLIVSSPVENQVYNSRTVQLLLNSNEMASMQYKDNIGGGNWKNLCSSCTQYSQTRNFNEGFNDVTFRATDGSGNTAFITKVFRIDSQLPRIRSVEPTEGLASGMFFVEFEEDNPTSLIIFYGNSQVGQRQAQINLASCTIANANKYSCETEVDLADYDGQTISFHAEVNDIANNVVPSSTYTLQVDNSDPLIQDFEYSTLGKKVTFHLEIAEPTFDSVKYIDLLQNNPQEKNLCSSLVNGVCHKQVSFSDGNHHVEVIVRDDAGNEVRETADFFIDSKKPKIYTTTPTGGFGSGEFMVTFKELNPTSLILHYGANAENTMQVDLNTCFDVSGDKKSCITYMDLSSYDGSEVTYYYTLEDIGGQSHSSNPRTFDVDMTAPVISSITYTMSGTTKADVVVAVTEQNLEEITYINNNENNPQSKRFCSNLNNAGVCTKKISLVPGQNSIDIQVIDEAGNSVAQNVVIIR